MTHASVLLAMQLLGKHFYARGRVLNDTNPSKAHFSHFGTALGIPPLAGLLEKAIRLGGGIGFWVQDAGHIG